QDVLVDLRWIDPRLDEPPRGLDDLRAAAVVESYPEVEALVAGRLPLELLHLLPEPRGRPVAPPDEAGADSLAHEIRKLALDRLAEDVHQRVDLAGGA